MAHHTKEQFEQIREYHNKLRDKRTELNDAIKREFELKGKLLDTEYELAQLRSNNCDNKDSIKLQEAMTRISQLETELSQNTTEAMWDKVALKQENDKGTRAAEDTALIERNKNLEKILNRYIEFFTAFRKATDIDPRRPSQQQLENEKSIAEARQKTIKNYESTIKKKLDEIANWKAKAVELQKLLDDANRRLTPAVIRPAQSRTVKSKSVGTLSKPGNAPEKRKRGSMETSFEDEDDEEAPLMQKWKVKRQRMGGEAGRTG
ncbi:hypothetical protein EJ03DRAFT_377912 [Teratosphaeria nubilosa]|uniref:Uncharacterized protein n=1 Tax=Teratosphaeria nubilosa TaxID=161662 RepID=A0A6G1KYI4_9PEZI|nr:hypothetical protein EJ03DRAFT_377912 [Teratosphaeria nubilosa]